MICSLEQEIENKFLCRPGVVGKRMAVQIQNRFEEIEEDIFNELTEGDEDE